MRANALVGLGEVIPTYCGFWRASVRGSVILSFSPPNKMRSKFTVSGTEKHGVPKITQFVGGSEAVLECPSAMKSPMSEQA